MTYADPSTNLQRGAGDYLGVNADHTNLTPSAEFSAGGVGGTSPIQLSDFKIIRRNGAVVSFEPSKIAIALTKAFLAVNGGQGAASARIR